MSNIKQATSDSHRRAEQTALMQAIMAGQLTPTQYAALLWNHWHCYSALEAAAPEIFQFELARAALIERDLTALGVDQDQLPLVPATLHYLQHVSTLDAEGVWAHVYVRYMGDLYGGQMLRRRLPGPTAHLDFVQRESAIQHIRSHITDQHIAEALRCFAQVTEIYEQLYQRFESASGSI
jgi:heme oxygenase (biliverdin-producing, ferredoxin)